ncbi:MAG: efflux RND transporter permease subunit [Opitutales bacterium]|nr:efflux RND transporter permease subunit [Opitutales bacterium]MCH8541715.1 efflux RND transporter permease subunit [Opitutales bacterium]
MVISEVSIRRPVVCTVICILIVLIGFLSFQNLPVREYPDTDPPIVSVNTVYPGADAEVVESRITDVLEEQISTIDGIRMLSSESREEVSQISIEFELGRNVDNAANDVRDRVGRARDSLPDEAREPSVEKTESDNTPIMWISVNSDRYNRLELTDFADRFGKRTLQNVSGVANVIIGGERRFAMRVWLSATQLAAYDLTPDDVEQALRQQNVEIPGGRIESAAREFSVRVMGDVNEVEEFENLVIAERDERQILLGEVARVEVGTEDYRTLTFFRGNPTVGLGVVRQSQSNLLEVAQGVRDRLPEVQAAMPEGVELVLAYDASVFVQESINEVYKTLLFAFGLVILVIFFFLRTIRATLIPLISVPVSLIGTFAAMQLFGFSINILTLLALVLAVGLVIDDAIVMLENIYRRMEEGEDPIQAGLKGSRQVAFAIIATTLSLIAVFLPVAFQEGSTGRLFFEFGITLAIAVAFSSFIALTLTPMLCSRFLRVSRSAEDGKAGAWLYRTTEPFFTGMNNGYSWALRKAMNAWPVVIIVALLFAVLAGPWSYSQLQSELVPEEDRGVFISFFFAPLGSTPQYTRTYVETMEDIVLETEGVDRVFSITNVGFGVPGQANQGLMFVGLDDWDERERSTREISGEIQGRYAQEVTGGLSFNIPIRPLSFGEDIQFVLQGSDFDQLVGLGFGLMGEMGQSGLFQNPRMDPIPNKPQLNLSIDRSKAADLGVRIDEIARTLETLMGSREVTTFKKNEEQYEVFVQIEDEERVTPADLGRVYVRSSHGEMIQLVNLVNWEETVVPDKYPRYNRFRSVVITANMAPGYTIGDGVAFLEGVRAELPPGVNSLYDGNTREFVESEGATIFLFILALLFCFLLLSAQFESFIHPLTIFTGVVLALAGGLLVLYLSNLFGYPMTDNLFSRFGLIMLIGLVAKNGILIVEFANQLQVQGRKAWDAAFEGASLRFRPILMTAISTVFGIMPIALASGPGAETRNPLGLVVVGGLSIATVFSLFVIPVVYWLMDGLSQKVFGRSSAYGLIRAAKIREDMAKEEAEAMKEKG